jgi:RND family efflux transporter MFP subunit
MNMLAPVDVDAPEIRAPEARAPVRDRRGWRWGVGALALLTVAGVAVVKLVPHGPPAGQALPPADVTAATPLARSVSEWDDYVGRFAASQAVEVRPRVSGQIVALHFKDGDLVKQGDVLFTIDQRPFLAAEAEAAADVAGAASALTLARSDLARATRLTGDDAVSQGEVDQLRAKVESAQASLEAAQARLRERALDVAFTTVRAPISGRVSDRRVDAGNLVVGGDAGAATLLTTINAIDPIYFDFDASEALFLKAQRNRQNGGAPTLVQIRLQDEPTYRWTGRLDFTDNGLDPRSGTIRGRATLTNAAGFLTPGLFGDMRLATGAPVPALLVPDAAIQTDQARKTLLVVGPDNSVTAKPVTLGALVGGLRIIRSGLGPNDRVVIEGMQGAMPGGTVTPHRGDIAPDASTDTAASDAPIAAQATFAR